MKSFSKLAASVALTLAAFHEAHAGLGSLALGYALGSSESTQTKGNPSRLDSKPACFVSMKGVAGSDALVNLSHVKQFDFSGGVITFNSGAKLMVKPFATPRDPEQYRQPGMPASGSGWDSAMGCDQSASAQSKAVFTFGSHRLALEPTAIDAIVIVGSIPPKSKDFGLFPFSATVMMSDRRNLEFETLAGAPPSRMSALMEDIRADWFSKRQEAGSKSALDALRMAQDQLSQAGATWTGPRSPRPIQCDGSAPKSNRPK